MYPKTRFSLVIFSGIAILVVGVCFRIPKIYPLWSDFGLERIATFINPTDSKLFFSIGDSYFGNGKNYNIRKAESAYKKAISLRPDFLEAHYQLGRIYFIRGKFDYALTEMKTVLAIDPEFKKAYYMYGLINGYNNNLDEAIYGFNEFIKRDDFNWAGYNDLAWIYFKKGDFEKTREIAKKGVDRAPTNPWLNNIYGTALMNLGEKEAARVAFEIALAKSEKMTPKDWGRSYPGNDPAIYAKGLTETQTVIRNNLALLDK